VLERELQQIWVAEGEVVGRRALTPLWNHLSYGETRAPYAVIAPFAVLFLQYEHLFPEEWGKGWGAKRHTLSLIGRRGPTPETHTDLLNLLDATIRRPQRAEDGGYAKVARVLDPATVRRIVRDAHSDGDANTQQRAGYVGWVLDNRSAAVSLASWRRWQNSVGSSNLRFAS
jgi:hypothetical protein